MASFLERYRNGDCVAVWDELTALAERVREEPYFSDAAAVAAETMRRARHNVEVLIRRLDANGYRFLDSVSTAEDSLSRLDVMGQLSSQIEAWAGRDSVRLNQPSMQLLDSMRAMKEKMAPMLEKASARASLAASAKRRPPLEDPQVFSPPDDDTPGQIARLERAARGPLPLSLRAWYEQVGGVSLMGSDAVLNPVEFSNRGVLTQFQMLTTRGPATQMSTGQSCEPDPLVMAPLEELVYEAEDMADGQEQARLELAIAPDDLHKANISGDAYYITLPDPSADFRFDDWHKTTFVNYLRLTFQWGGFPGWERSRNPPRKQIAELAEGLLPL